VLTVYKLKIAAGGQLVPQNCAAFPGQENLTYAITGVPHDVPIGAVVRQANKCCLVGRSDDPKAWVYDWSEIASKPQGAIINHYAAI